MAREYGTYLIINQSEYYYKSTFLKINYTMYIIERNNQLCF